MKHYVWYRKEPTFRSDKDLTIRDIINTHVRVTAMFPKPINYGETKENSLEDIYSYMQAERWSEFGTARPLIEALGLKHTSMSVGDVIEDEEGNFYEVDVIGFRKLEV